MLYPRAKRYPLIGLTPVEIPTDDLPYLNPVEGFAPDPEGMTAIDFTNGMYLTNIRNKIFVLVINTDEDDAMTVTPVVTALVGGYAPVQAPITVAAGGVLILGPFSANYETAGKVNFTFTGTTPEGLILAGRIT